MHPLHGQSHHIQQVLSCGYTEILCVDKLLFLIFSWTMTNSKYTYTCRVGKSFNVVLGNSVLFMMGSVTHVAMCGYCGRVH